MKVVASPGDQVPRGVHIGAENLWPGCRRWPAGVRLHVTEVNAQPGAIAIDSNNRLVGVMGLDIADGQIQTIRSIANPDKLRHLDTAFGRPIRPVG